MRKHWASLVLAVLAIVLAGCAPVTTDDPSAVTASTAGASAPAPTVKPGKTAPKAVPTIQGPTRAQAEAMQAAGSYLHMTGFSRDGLIQQLTAKTGENFDLADATYAVDHLDVDWNAEAVVAARAYLDTGSFSHRRLVDQLSSKYGSRFTRAQAEYAVKKVGL